MREKKLTNVRAANNDDKARAPAAAPMSGFLQGLELVVNKGFESVRARVRPGGQPCTREEPNQGARGQQRQQGAAPTVPRLTYFSVWGFRFTEGFGGPQRMQHAGHVFCHCRSTPLAPVVVLKHR